MTYAPPEGVSIGDFTADTLPASFNAPVGAGISYKIYGTAAGVGTATSEGEPEGYKIPILNTSGVTENLVPEISTANGWRQGFLNNDGTYNPAHSRGEWLSPLVDIRSATSISIAYKPVSSGASQSMYFFDSNGNYISNKGQSTNGYATFTNFPEGIAQVCYAFRTYCLTEEEIVENEMWTCLVKGDIPPDHYIPHRYESNYDLFIGDTKLGAEEYVDYAEQKIYKMSGSTLVPTDPPLPLPSIITYDGENTISSTETLGNVELTGDWTAIMGSTEDESIDIEFTVDAEDYIAFVTVDDGPLTQVSDTITMPSSADSFSLEVVAWGRERYTDTVYNALS